MAELRPPRSTDTAAFIDDLRRRGIILSVRGDALVCDAPRGGLTSADKLQLRAGKAAIIAALERAADAGQAARPRTLSRDVSVPLGLVQQRMWLLDRLDGASTANNLPGAWRLKGALDVDAFTAAVREIVRRHDILRTRIDTVDGEPRQFIDDDFVPDVPVADLRARDAEAAAAAMMQEIRSERDRPFDLSQLPLFRIRLFRLADDEHVLFLLPHHVIWDGWSWDVFHDELSALYDAFRTQRPSPLQDLQLQYADYAVRHRELMSGPELRRQLDYWCRQLEGELPLLRLPVDQPRPATLSQRGDRRLIPLGGDVIDVLWQIGRDEDATLFMVLLTAYAAWLIRYTGQDDLTIGVPTQDRLEAGVERLIGVFVNTLVIRVKVAGRPTFRELLRQVRDACIEAYDHQDIPFDRLVEELGVQRSASWTPLYQTLFTYQDVTRRPERIGDLGMSQVHVDTGSAPTDVLFGVMVGRHGTVALLDFNADLFAAPSMDRMAASFSSLLGDVAQDADRPVHRLSLAVSGGRRGDAVGGDLFAGHDASAPESVGQLTPAQEGMWFTDRATGRSTVHHLVDRFRVVGELSVPLLNAAVRHASERHEVLRHRFPEVDGVPTLEVLARLEDVVSFHDVAGAPDAAAAAESILYDALHASFDLGRGPLVRGCVVHVGRGEHVLQLVFHHLILDEPSLGVLYADIAEAYDALASGTVPAPAPESPSFRRFVADVRAALGSAEQRRGLDWWSDRLADPAPPLDIADRTRPPLLSLDGASVPLLVDAALTAEMDRAAAAAGVDTRVFMLTALQAVLYRYSGQRRIACGLPVDLRPEGEDWKGTVGLFLNTVVVECVADDDRSFTDQLRVNREVAEAAFAHGAVPFTKVVEQVQPARSSNHAPLYQVLLSMEPAPAARLEFAGLRAEPQFTERPGLPLDLAFYLNREVDGWTGRIDFSTDLFERATIEKLAGHVRSVLAAAIRDPGTPLGGLELLTADERELLLTTWNSTARAIGGDTVLERIAQQCAASGAAPAVTQSRTSVSRSALWRRSGEVAHALCERGVARGDTVGICFERSPDMLVAVLGAWRAGAAYLPLDPDFPEQRLAFMVEDSGCTLVLTDGVAEDVLPVDYDGAVMLSELESEERSARTQLPQLTADDHAYTIYTSGSTGRPKGVEVAHGALLNFIASMAELPGLRPEDVLLAVTTLSFDISILELILPLWVGARVEIASDEDTYDGELLSRRITSAGVTALQATPATWRMLIDAGGIPRLRTALCGGEAFPSDLAAPLLDSADEVWNMYGPTETTIWSAVHRVTHRDDGSIPIGRPIANTRAYIVDPRGRTVPAGVPGELWLGGRGVARGYHARPDLTAERFLPDPFTGEGRVYRTGDLARWRADGTLEHLGRLDDQVKVRGFRIELGEIEAVLAQHDAVAQAVVAVKQGSDGESRLVAYVIWQGRETMLVSELRRFIAQRLPDYMVPGVMLTLDELPLTPNGKVDRGALPNPLVVAAVREFVEPATPAQLAVAAVWREVLQQERIGQHDNFFELGGHSLLSIRAVALVEERIGVRLDPRSLFFQTLAQVATDVEGAQRALARLA